MKTAMNKPFSLLVCGALAAGTFGGCIIFDDPHCEVSASMPAPTRNPYTGQCEYGDWSGSDDCSANGGGDVPTQPPSADPGDATDEAYSGWGACYSQCEALGEQACIQTSGCQAAYVDYPNSPSDVQGPLFWGCWATATGYAPTEQACDVLGAELCVLRDDCSPRYRSYDDYGAQRESEPEPAPSSAFVACSAEAPAAQGCYGPDECSPGYECTAATECLPPPGCNGDVDCPAVCYGYCMPVEEPPPLPGNCYGDIVCNSPPPQCPDGTIAGRSEGCWTGFCIPNHACETIACGSIGDEATCMNAAQCDAVYQGHNCTCDGAGCACESMTYAYCQDA